MNHRYDKKDIPEGAAFIVETCRFCTAISRRYNNGFRTYYDFDGKQLAKAVACTGKPPVEHLQVLSGAGIKIVGPEVRNYDYATDSHYEKLAGLKETLQQGFKRVTPEVLATQANIIHKKFTPMQRGAPPPNQPDIEARLRDSIVLVKLLYEDLVKNNVNSQAREMAGRYLYSNGYKELVDYLNKKNGN